MLDGISRFSGFASQLLLEDLVFGVERGGLGALGASEASFVVAAAVMSTQPFGGVESLGTRIARLWILKFARERLNVLMKGEDVMLQSCMLPEGLVTAFVASTPVFLLLFVGSFVPAQTSASGKLFITAFPVTNIITNSAVSGFEVVFEMRFAEKIFIATFG